MWLCSAISCWGRPLVLLLSAKYWCWCVRQIQLYDKLLILNDKRGVSNVLDIFFFIAVSQIKTCGKTITSKRSEWSGNSIKGYHSQLQIHYSCQWSSSLVQLLCLAWCFQGNCKNRSESTVNIWMQADLVSASNIFLQMFPVNSTDPLMMRACSSIKFPSPITMGPASAMIRAFGWTTVLGPGRTKSRHDVPNVILQLIDFSVYQAMCSYPKITRRDGSYLWWHLPLFHFPHTPRLRQLFWRWNNVKKRRWKKYKC